MIKNKKVLIVSPHPDDEVVGCGGLIKRIKENGGEVFVLYVSVGQCRQLVTGQTEENTRLKETEEVSRFFDFNYKFVFIGEEFMRLDSLPQKSLIDPIEDKIQEFKPDIVCIPCKDSYDQDHRAVFNACITALRPTPQGIRHFVPIVLEYEEPYSWSLGEGFKPNFFLNITNQLDSKIKGLKLHTTQYREDPFARSGENLIRLSGMRGKEVGIKYAEAYKLHRIFI